MSMMSEHVYIYICSISYQDFWTFATFKDYLEGQGRCFFPGGISHGYVGLFSGRDLEDNDAT